MLVIRLSRGGSKKRPFYHIVATDSRNARDGRFIERLGYYNPHNEKEINVNIERYDYWLQVGGQASDRVKSIVKQFRAQA